MNKLIGVESHFSFGDNWQSFVTLVDDDRIRKATAALASLLLPEELSGKTMLDIGCGSGLSALAAVRMGARVTCTDIDPKSVEATRTLLGKHAPPESWSAELVSVFDLPSKRYGIVHSWGVLHHTGAMWRAIETASNHVEKDGLLAIAIYRKTQLCEFWRREKAFYTTAPKWVQWLIRRAYGAVWFAANVARGKYSPAVQAEYQERGMDWRHDVHDWLGGYPYESAAPDEIHTFLASRGFSSWRQNIGPKRSSGLLGSGCDEYVFRRVR